MFPPPHVLRLGPLCLAGYQQITEVGTRRAASLEMSSRVLVDKVLWTGRTSEEVKPQSRRDPNRTKASSSALFLHIPVSQRAHLCPAWPVGLLLCFASRCSEPGPLLLVPS